MELGTKKGDYQTGSVDLPFFVGLPFGQEVDVIGNWTPVFVVQVDLRVQAPELVQPVWASAEVSEIREQIIFSV